VGNGFGHWLLGFAPVHAVLSVHEDPLETSVAMFSVVQRDESHLAQNVTVIPCKPS